ncbi:Fanconi anemia group C protein [Gastrophryne carolinensis]
MASVTAVSELDIENWLSKTIEWVDTTTLETQQDVCLHLPKLQEFLLQIYKSLKHMNTDTVIATFPAIGQFLGRLCWNPIVIGHDDTRKMLMCCLCCLYCTEPQSVIEKKANSWIKNLVCHLFSSFGQEDREAEIIAQLGCSNSVYQDKLLKNVISSLILQIRKRHSIEVDKQFLAEHVHRVSVTCISVVALPEVSTLLETLLNYHGPGPNEVLDNVFLETINDAILRKKTVLSESAVLSLWLRHLPSLEKAVLDLFQRLIVLQNKSLKEMEEIMRESFLPHAALHPSIFRVIDNILRNLLLESDGNNKVQSIIRLFTRCFIKGYDKENVQPKLPLKMYFSYESPAVLLALLRKSEGLISDACVEHLRTVVTILKNLTAEKGTPQKLFESWFLLIHFGEWVDIAAEQLLTSDPEISDDLLWLLAFYYNPCNENQSRTRTMVEAKSAYEYLISVFRQPTVCVTLLQQIFQTENKSNQWHPCTLQLVRHLCVSFLLLAPEWHNVISDCICHMTQTQEAASEVTDVLARTLSRLDIPRIESRKIITIAQRLLHDS